ncbi:MAG: hypothetical protein F2681_05195 [Actinobacteria bacterium]|uniref:Unannotated protein n=3 Tax=freshwater metagenome TaxID=449393 RepID=A0A6J6QZH7_9ZZZZ|nr:hypothetical protein [Actinomycetota bacterium]MSZ82520.1 hypothetical protein [Actinomycetota bacterium]MTB17734.1 hypothetical protein [Actinomycetota bacterium]
MPHAVRITGRWVALLTVATLAVGCSGSDSNGGDSGVATTDTLAPGDTAMLEPLFCDPLDERACLLPWPNDAFTRPDDTTPTGRRLDILDGAAPQNVDGVPIDLTDQNRADGFSPGSSILAFVPMLDVERTGIAPSTNIAASLNDDAPIVILDTDAGTRVAYWAELDATGPVDDQVLIVHPAEALAEGHHFIVALRNLVDTDGRAIQRTPAFQSMLDGAPEPPQRAYPFRDLFAALDTAGISTPGLYLAWDFTVASADSLSGRLLHMRAETYDGLGNGAPAFAVTTATDDGTVRTVDGTYDVPNYLTGDGSPGNKFDLGPDGLPRQNTDTPVLHVPFRCVLPLGAATPVPAIVYGHGLMGTLDEVGALSFAAAAGLAAACATDEIGMSSTDLPNLVTVLGNLSHFPEQADRMQQGLLNQQLLGRLLNSPTGFVTDSAFQSGDGHPLVANGATQFVGNSQGGILGGAASAISTEWSRVVLGVPGITYSLLLPRSSDWPQFASVFEQAYPDPADRLLAMQLIQLLWDRGENNGYAQHLTSDPYPGIPAKQVLMIEAFGDHQVANVSTEVLARTLGAAALQPTLASGRSKDVVPQWGLPGYTADAPITALLEMWDFGTPAPPTVNLPPTEPEYGQDPHGAGSREPKVLQEAFTFLFTGTPAFVCGGLACTSTVLSG